MKEIVTFAAFWVVIPFILLGIVLLSRLIVSRSAEGEQRLSVRAGFWAGLVAFVAFVAADFDPGRTPQVEQLAIDVNLTGFAVAAAGGFALVALIRTLLPTNLAGFVVLLLAFSGSSALYSYLFVPESGTVLVPATLGLAFGVLIQAVISPRSIYEFFPQESTWLEALRDFERQETLRQIDFKRKNWPELPDGAWADQPVHLYPHVLPEGHLKKNVFFPPVADQVMTYAHNHHISIHHEALNLGSPKIACFNLLFPLRQDLELAAKALEPALPGVKAVQRIELDYLGDQGTATWLGEPGGRKNGRTLANLAIWWEDGKRSRLTLGLWQYTEYGFAGCDGFDSRGNQHKEWCLGLNVLSPNIAERCYLASGSNHRLYWQRMKEAGINLQVLSQVQGCPFRGPFYELMTQHVLAAHLRSTEKVDEVDVVSFGFRGNKSIFDVPPYLRKLGSNVIAAWNTGLVAVPAVRHVYVESIVQALETKGSNGELVGYLRDRYGV